MKKIIILTAIAISIASCNSSKLSVKYLTDHNFKETHIIHPNGTVRFHASIDSLYNFKPVEDLCDTADVTFHISKASIVVDANCTGAGQSLVEYFKEIIKRIKF